MAPPIYGGVRDLDEQGNYLSVNDKSRVRANLGSRQEQLRTHLVASLQERGGEQKKMNKPEQRLA